MTAGWRDLTGEEVASWPKARLGGGLLALLIMSGALTVTLVAVFAAIAINPNNLSLLGASLGRELSFRAPISMLGLTSLTSALSILFVGATFFVLALLRVASTPKIIAILLVFVLALQLVTDLGVTLFAAVAGGGGIRPIGLFAHFLPAWIGLAALVAAACGYLSSGVRPNAYFRRRVAVPTSPQARTAP